MEEEYCQTKIPSLKKLNQNYYRKFVLPRDNNLVSILKNSLINNLINVEQSFIFGLAKKCTRICIKCYKFTLPHFYGIPKVFREDSFSHYISKCENYTDKDGNLKSYEGSHYFRIIDSIDIYYFIKMKEDEKKKFISQRLLNKKFITPFCTKCNNPLRNDKLKNIFKEFCECSDNSDDVVLIFLKYFKNKVDSESVSPPDFQPKKYSSWAEMCRQ